MLKIQPDGDAASESSTLREATDPLSMSRYSIWVRVSMGLLVIQYLGKKVWGCGLGSFDLVRCNGHCQHVGLGHRNGAY